MAGSPDSFYSLSSNLNKLPLIGRIMVGSPLAALLLSIDASDGGVEPDDLRHTQHVQLLCHTTI
jgi:hypothetical protein